MTDQKFKIIFIGLFIMFAQGCAKHEQTFEPNYGVTTVKQAKQQLGEPQKEKDSVVLPNQKILTFENGVQLQAESGIVIAKSRLPLGDEKVLQHWFHLLQKSSKDLKALATLEHNKTEYMLVDAKHGISIVYNTTLNAVVRVYEYAKK